MTYRDVLTMSGSDLIALYGVKAEQMIIDLLIMALKSGEDEANGIEQKLLQVQREVWRRGRRMS
ncbi:hypothetical protein HL653_07090 [Sphingomonas sp. AP4-R1]|uniref:hypothetical protein n=1 Tax=Sphingomonas sp. AP4-R1 TaxID=2735134 RepID=UPI001493C932|nr:hypothetical protein [Sphingomonas sp. AP4-R1]QJU57582.1 hypothetical protein HL653_07090 [Sphingomonas sp. AP4-R1]